MSALMGDNATTPALTEDQKLDFLDEALRMWMAQTPNYPATSLTDLIDVSVDDRRAFIGIINMGPGSMYIREILSVHGGSAITNTPLERIGYSEIIRLQNDVGATGTPTHYAVAPAGDVGYGASSQRGEWYVYCYPIPTSDFVFGYTVSYYLYQTGGTTITIRLPYDEALMCARLAAALAAPLLPASPELVAELWRPMDERMAAMRRVARLGRRPGDSE